MFYFNYKLSCKKRFLKIYYNFVRKQYPDLAIIIRLLQLTMN